MAESEKLGRLISDIVSGDGVRGASRKTGLSEAYVSELRKGRIPRDRAMLQFIAGYPDLGEEARTQLLDTYREARRGEVDTDGMLQIVLGFAGLPTSERLKVLRCFREARDRTVMA